MLSRDNIDLKLFLAFVNKYQELEERGEITYSQLEEVMALIDKYEELTADNFKEQLAGIFEK